LAARAGDALAFPFPTPLAAYRDCNFSLAGLKNTARRIILSEERKHGMAYAYCIPRHMSSFIKCR
jgi:tRNA A37 threonylcarbamoyltransferase TsaD